MGAPATLTRAILALALVCSLAGSGCLRRILPAPRPAEPKATLISVPYVEPRTEECGPASLAMMLQWSGLAVDADALAPALMAKEQGGALQLSLVAETRRQGRLAYPITGIDELLRELDAGHPVLVLQNLGLSWLQYWHYAVVIGVDRERDVVVLHSGKDASREVEFAIFDRTWARGERWGLVVLPPTQLPATATEPRVVDAAVGLERAGRNDSAALAYRSTLKRWPLSLAAWIGLGNAEFAGGDLSAAEQAFRRASELYPRSIAARNNLDYVRAQRSGAR